MFVVRDLVKAFKRFYKFPVIALLGPRHSGKKMVAKTAFNRHGFVTLEDLKARVFAQNDPQRFLKEYATDAGIIIDQIHYVPSLVAFIKQEAKEKRKPHFFIITASYNIVGQPDGTESFSGHVAVFTLLPFSLHELKQNNLLDTVDETIFKGSYPSIYSEHIQPQEVYPTYIHSFIERDVLKVIKSDDLVTFQKFMQLCAGRIAQLLNISDLATQCGITRRTAELWLSVLEANFIIFFLQPYSKCFNKRITKTPKLYFYDSGLAASLLDMQNAKDLARSHFRGQLFECMMIADIVKQYFNKGMKPCLYFWRELNGRVEVDCLIDRGSQLIPLEMKAGETVADEYFQGLKSWDTIVDSDPSQGYLIYGGASVQLKTTGNLVGWREAGSLVSKIEPEL